uniref:Chondroitin proteoglycan 4 domain-containing protein n=1 Tax=Panagrolaimus sp. PS1159 TaxID=55785 RepID=A0AC35FX02_9BILA
MLVFYLLSFFIVFSNAAKFVDQISRQSSQLLVESQNGKMIRQCSCVEQNECVISLKTQMSECFDICFHTVKDAGINVESLKNCFHSKQYIVDDLVSCIQGTMKTCTNSQDGKQIPYTDINIFFTKGEKKLHQQAEMFLATMGDSGRALIDSALDVGSCIKDCVIKKNVGGYCFDHKKCQPLIEAKQASKSLKKCIKSIGWKKEASDLCECTVKAGVSEMGQYCSMLKTITGSERRGHRKND